MIQRLLTLLVAVFAAGFARAHTIRLTFDPYADVDQHLERVLAQLPPNFTLIDVSTGVIYVRGWLVMDLSALPEAFAREIYPELYYALNGERAVGDFYLDTRRARVLDFSQADFKMYTPSVADRRLRAIEARMRDKPIAMMLEPVDCAESLGPSSLPKGTP